MLHDFQHRRVIIIVIYLLNIVVDDDCCYFDKEPCNARSFIVALSDDKIYLNI